MQGKIPFLNGKFDSDLKYSFLILKQALFANSDLTGGILDTKVFLRIWKGTNSSYLQIPLE